MNLKLYGICFKMKSGPDLLSYVQDGRPVPVEVMEQVMSRIGSITPEEIAFAERLDKDWKKAFNEKVPLLMGVAADGGYDISCNVPDPLLETVGVLTGLKNEKIIEEYTADYLKRVCGVDADIISVDMEQGDEIEVKAQEASGFNFGDLTASPEEPAFEDVSNIDGMDVEIPLITETAETPVKEDTPISDGADIYEDPEDEEPVYAGDDVPIEEGYPEEETFPDEEETYEEPDEEIPDEEEEIPGEADDKDAAPDDKNYQEAVTGIYKDLVENIRDRQLDTRLGLKIGRGGE